MTHAPPRTPDLSWAEPDPTRGPHVLRLTRGPFGHRHTYYAHNPFSRDGQAVLLMRYRPQDVRAEVGLIDLTSGAVRTFGDTASWRGLVGANLRWASRWPGPQPADGVDRVLFADTEDGRACLVVTQPGGQDAQRFVHDHMARSATMDGRFIYATTPFVGQFPGGDFAPRDRTGLFRMDPSTGQWKLLVSVNDCLALHPRRDVISDWHLFIKQVHVHPREDALLMMFGNDCWFQVLPHENPPVKSVYVCRLDGSALECVNDDKAGQPSWRPTGRDGVRRVPAPGGQPGERLAIHRGDADWRMDFLGEFTIGPHPLLGPDGQCFVSEKGAERGGRAVRAIALHDLINGGERTVAAHPPSDAPTTYFAQFLRHNRRPAPAELVAAIGRGDSPDDPVMLEPCPVWSHDGRYILFNSMDGDVSQLFAIDVAAAARSSPAAGSSRR